MANDKLFNKRKARQAKDLKRRKARRDPYAKVLIVCEGEKTEPHYFNGLKDHYGLNSANVEVSGESGSDPVSVVTHARQRYREERDAGDAFDRVYCVIDRDSHANYQMAVDQINRGTPKDTWFTATSVPCFEYWILLHFNYSTRPYERTQRNSPCAQVIEELRQYLPNYAKGKGDLFGQLFGQLEHAKHNASRSLRTAEENHTDNPSTRVHELVEFLQNIKGLL